MTTPLHVPIIFQEENLNDECRELLSSLPREPSWIMNDMYQYEGVWLSPLYLQGLLGAQKHFQAQDSDIILVSCPKSGTTWLKAIAFALLNRSRFLDLDQHPLLASNPHDLVPYLELNLYRGKELPDLSTITTPRLFATHVPFKLLPASVKDTSCKIVYLCRNPNDIFVSLWHFTNKLKPEERASTKLEDALEKFCNGVTAYGPFWDQILGYWHESLKNPHKVLFLRYEEIHDQSTTQLKRLAEFMNCPFSPEEDSKGTVDKISKLCSFDHLSNLKVNKAGISVEEVSKQAFYRKGKVGDWTKVLTPEMAEKINLTYEDKMPGFAFKY